MKYTLLLFLLFLNIVTAQNRLYVRVEYNPSMQLLGFGGSGFFYDHILLLPDGTAFRFDDVSDNFDQVLPGGIHLVAATAGDLATTNSTRGTYQDDTMTVTTSFGVSFASSGEEYSSVMEESGYMFIPPLQPSFITGEYNSFGATVIGGGITGTPSVAGYQSDNYFFYADGKFGFEESSGVSSDAGNVAATFSSEGSAAGSYLFEGYNLYITYNDDTQVVLPAYLWPPYQPFLDQILMVGGDEFLNEEESSLPIQLLPANTTNPLNNTAQNPLTQTQSANPLSTQPANPLTQPSQENPLTQTPSDNPLTPSLSPNTLTGLVTAPTGIPLNNGLVVACPYDMVDENDCLNTLIDTTGAYAIELSVNSYLLMAAIDVTGDGLINHGDYVNYQNIDMDGQNTKTVNFVLEPYSE
jgi:hypothetical protein